MNRKVVARTANLVMITMIISMGLLHASAQESVPISVSLSAPDDVVPAPPEVVALPETGFGIGMDATNLVFMVMVVAGIALTYIGTLNMRRTDS